MKIQNLISSNGNKIANQFSVNHNGIRYFQSYDSVCAKYSDNILTLGCDWDYSRTTLKYLYIWMEDNAYSVWSIISNSSNKRASLQELIDSGVIQYDGGMR